MFGVKDPKVQEQVSAVVVLKPISSHIYPAVTEVDIAGFVNSRYVSLPKMSRQSTTSFVKNSAITVVSANALY